MKKSLFLTALFACFALPVSAQTVHINPQTMENLPWQDVTFSKTLTTELSEQQKQAFTTSFAGTESPVAAYRIPANQGPLSIEITSPVADNNVFIPSAVILDSNFNLAAQYDSSHFQFKEERGMQPNRFTAELDLTPTANQDYIYLLIYTTAQDLSKTTTVPHPAKAYAKATGTQPPAIDDIVVKHSRHGEVAVNVSNGSGTRFIGLSDILPTSKKTTSTVVGTTATTATTTATVAKASQGNKQAVTTAVDKDTEAYFNQAVSKALKANDINKAMNLVNEAEKLGLTSPRQTFLKQVSAK
ncbi:maltose operon protein MalM [Lonepinella koalarum]|uniref:maltose operon protein MalM n=1 Tax=Lonepinella koalarum TaxID=53417 RepID=UPI003F6E37DF